MVCGVTLCAHVVAFRIEPTLARVAAKHRLAATVTSLAYADLAAPVESAAHALPGYRKIAQVCVRIGAGTDRTKLNVL